MPLNDIVQTEGGASMKQTTLSDPGHNRTNENRRRRNKTMVGSLLLEAGGCIEHCSGQWKCRGAFVGYR